MKTTKTIWRFLAIVLVIAFFGWMQISKQMAVKLELNNNSNQSQNTSGQPGLSASNSSKTALSNNSLYYRYWRILKSRSVKHKV